MIRTAPEVRQSLADAKTLEDGTDGRPINKSTGTPSTAAASPLSSSSFPPHSSPEHDEQDDVPSTATATETTAAANATTMTAMTIIHQAYGPNADLYRDVLRVEPTANDREIRTAYFRRGRQVLHEPDVEDVYANGDNNEAAGAEEGSLPISAVSQQSKLQFQAVSAAFDILSDPELRRQYDASGTVPSMLNTSDLTYETYDDGTTNEEAGGVAAGTPARTTAPAHNHLPTVAITGTSLFIRSRSLEGATTKSNPLKNSVNGRYGTLRRSRSRTGDGNSSTGSSKRGIRWSNSVEELVIENDCASIASRRSWKCGGSLDDVQDEEEHDEARGRGAGDDKDDDNNSVVSIESAASSVKETLRRLDESAETFTRKEFLDELESSVTTLLDAAARAITEASAAAAAVTTTAESSKEVQGHRSEPTDKDSVSRRLDFDKVKDDDPPQNEESKATTSSQDAAAAANTKAVKEDPAADFYLFLSTYICGVVQELKGSLDHVGSMCSDGQIPDASSCVIQDAELDGLVHMLRTEVDQHAEGADDEHPFDEDPSGESPLGKTIETFDTESIASTIATERNAPAGN